MSSMAAIRAHADRVALTLMSSGDDRDWLTWTVDVRNTAGRRVFLREFTKVRVSEGPAQ